MELLEYIKRNYRTPNPQVLKSLGASEELIGYLRKTPWNTNIKVVEGLISGNSDDEKQGIKSIIISPAITTTPALESMFPIYWDDLTEEERELSVNITVDLDPQTEPAEYTFTLTPTNDMYAGIKGVGTDSWVIGENKGDSVSATIFGLPSVNNAVFVAASALDGDEPPEKVVTVNLIINREQS